MALHCMLVVLLKIDPRMLVPCWESACLECAASRAIGRAASEGASNMRCFFACTALVGAAGRAPSLLRFTPFPGLRLGAKPATHLHLNSLHDVLPSAPGVQKLQSESKKLQQLKHDLCSRAKLAQSSKHLPGRNRCTASVKMLHRHMHGSAA